MNKYLRKLLNLSAAMAVGAAEGCAARPPPLGGMTAKPAFLVFVLYNKLGTTSPLKIGGLAYIGVMLRMQKKKPLNREPIRGLSF